MSERPHNPVLRARAIVEREYRAIAVGLGLSAAVGALLFRVWRIHPRVPVVYVGDAVLSMGAIQNLNFSNWYSSSDLVGVPFGQDLLDFPAVGDFLHLVVLWLLTRFTEAPGLVFNLFTFGSFATVCVAGYVGCRMLRIGRTSAVAVGLLYTYLPYHVLHGPAYGHLFLGSYFAVPLWTALAVRQLGMDPLVGSPPTRRPSAWWPWLSQPGHTGALLIVILGATTGLYYALFMLLAFVVAGSAGWITHRDRARAQVAACFVALTAGLLALQFLPTWLLHLRQGANSQVLDRPLRGLENYSLTLSDLVLPVDGHRIDWFASLRENSRDLLLQGERAEALGVVAVVGLAALGFVAIIRLLRGEPGRRAGALAVVAITFFLMATAGGGATVLGILGMTLIRAWCRIAIVLAFCGLAFVGMGFDTLRKRLSRVSASLVMATVVLVGLLDTNPGFPLRDYDITAAEWSADEAFVAEVESMLGPDSWVFQLPVIPFPEHPVVHRMVDYDHLRAYLHSDTLGWSYGGVKGREADWQQALANRPIKETVAFVARAGFDALWLDRFGYGLDVNQMEEGLGSPALVSVDERVAVYDLRLLKKKIQDSIGPIDQDILTRHVDLLGALDESAMWADNLNLALLEPVTVALGEGFHGLEVDANRQYSWAESEAILELDNASQADRSVELEFLVASALEGQWTLVVEWPGSRQTISFSESGDPVGVDVTVPPEGLHIRLAVDSPRLLSDDPRAIHFRVFEPFRVSSHNQDSKG